MTYLVTRFTSGEMGRAELLRNCTEGTRNYNLPARTYGLLKKDFRFVARLHLPKTTCTLCRHSADDIVKFAEW